MNESLYYTFKNVSLIKLGDHFKVILLRQICILHLESRGLKLNIGIADHHVNNLLREVATPELQCVTDHNLLLELSPLSTYLCLRHYYEFSSTFSRQVLRPLNGYTLHLACKPTDYRQTHGFLRDQEGDVLETVRHNHAWVDELVRMIPTEDHCFILHTLRLS